ncbi:MAG: response regulator [Candidatus Rokuibacteriota bacterium]|nr:MAG: response regulator [Candidatus Rokubacteria bacterium]
MYESYLAAQGIHVLAAADGLNAVRIAQVMQPDVIVMDLSLPSLDGWEATRRLKHDVRTAHIPVLACTGHATDLAVDWALDAGCDAYVVKPCLPQELLRLIRGLLARRKSQHGA